jgi:predicted CopG family antitoxin
MAVKTITIDIEAYERLKRAKKKDESFSQTIKRIVPKPFDMSAWLRKVDRMGVSDQVLDAVEEEVTRRRSPGNLERGRAVS